MDRDPACSLCKLGNIATPANVCIIDSEPADLLVVSRSPMGQRMRAEFEEYLSEVGWMGTTTYTAVNKCRVYDVNATKTEQKLCGSTYLPDEVRRVKPKLIVALGGEALLVTTGRSGIMKYRGREGVFKETGTPVLPTISPSMVKRNPGNRSLLVSDLRYAVGMIDPERYAAGQTPRVMAVTTHGGLQRVSAALRAADGVAFDLETSGFNEYMPDSAIVSISFTVWKGDDAEVYAVPLCHPESPFREDWRRVHRYLIKAMATTPKRVAHNGKFDLRWINQMAKVGFVGLTFDTMLAAHLLNENRVKGLKPLAQALLGARPWDISTKDLMNEKLMRILKYNGLDTWWTYQLYKLFRQQLMEQPRLATLMAKLMVPASNVFTPIEMRGIWTDRDVLMTRAKIAQEKLDGIDSKIMEYVPDQDEWPAGVKAVNFNRSKFMMWFLFDHLEMPVIARGKNKADGSPGDPSMAEAVLQHFQKDHPHPVIDLLLERTQWQKYTTAFFAPYVELIDENDRIHTTFKLTGTVTGRLSSGKGDDEKVTGRVQNRGVNLQQVPRDGFVRGVFGAPPGHLFVECDYSQVELRVAAFVAQEKNMLHLYNTGQDIHMQMAMRMTGKPKDQVTKEERKKAKAVNFGFLYGMGWAKFIETAWSNYGVVVTEAEAQAFRRAFFDEFPSLVDWHKRQRRLVAKYGRVESPLGRIRHLPDIHSEDQGVKAEAQRQSINSPVQSFASDMAVMALIKLDRYFMKHGYGARAVGTVHDAINFEIPMDEAPRVVPLIRRTMENLPLERFGVHLNLPIVADAKIGVRWGDSIEVDNDISSNPAKLKEWIDEHFSA